jgi:hypothetical protein
VIIKKAVLYPQISCASLDAQGQTPSTCHLPQYLLATFLT